MGFDFVQTFPGGGNEGNINTLRINIRASSCLKQNLNPKDQNHFQTGGELYSWSLIAPTDIQETVSHTWEEYSSIQGRIAQLKTDVKKSGIKSMDLFNGLSTVNGSTAAAMNKVDSPLVYTGSNRRQYNFTFPMMIHHHHGSKEVAGPIDEFRRYSCASIGDVQADTIEFPAIFSIESWPKPFIFVEWCALTDIQVTYNAPYRFGAPQRAELSLTFLDVRPLYRSSWVKVADGVIETETYGGR